MVKFCIFSRQRSGSSWLLDLLYNHEDIRILSEVFLNRPPKHRPGTGHLHAGVQRYYEFKNNSERSRPWVTYDYLNALPYFGTVRLAFGFKLMSDQLKAFPEIWLKLIRDQYKIIYLVRENYLDVIISNVYMSSHGRSHVSDESSSEPEKLTIDPVWLLGALNREERSAKRRERFVALSPMKSYRVVYEDLASSTQETVGNICDFLGVKQMESSAFQSRLQRVNPGSYADKIENFVEIVDALRGTRFERFIVQNRP